MIDLWLAPLLAVASALLSAAVSLWAFRLGKNSVKIASSEERFNQAFSSFDLTTIGDYLRSEFGSVALDVYARDEVVRRSLDKSLSRISEFLDASDPPRQHEEPDVPPSERPDDAVLPGVPFARELDTLPDDAPAVVTALESLRRGEVWNSLAKLRRDVEIDIREVFGETRSIPINNVILRTEMPDEVAKELKYFYGVASRAIHGGNVSFDEAVRAVQGARQFYRHLQIIRRAPF